MEDRIKQIAGLLHDTSETHHSVFKLINGNDLDWASWYSDWLINLSNLSELLGVKPVRSELTYMLVKLDKDYQREKPQEKWEDYYAKSLIEHFSKDKQEHSMICLKCGLKTNNPSGGLNKE